MLARHTQVTLIGNSRSCGHSLGGPTAQGRELSFGGTMKISKFEVSVMKNLDHSAYGSFGVPKEPTRIMQKQRDKIELATIRDVVNAIEKAGYQIQKAM
jgi:hypothetical protein